MHGRGVGWNELFGGAIGKGAHRPSTSSNDEGAVQSHTSFREAPGLTCRE